MIFALLVQPLVLFVVGAGVPRAWENLLRSTRAMFRASREFDPGLKPVRRMPDGSTYRPCEGAMALFLDALAKTVEVCQGMKVTLIAHSMGSMIANEALEYKSNLPYESLVYPAPACSVREFERAVGPIIRTRAEAYILTLHPKVEAGQRDWKGWIGGGSVLEWLEGILVPPHTYLDRPLGKWGNALRTAHVYDPEAREKIHIKSFSYYGKNPMKPCRHVDFNDPDVEFWREDFWKPSPPKDAALQPTR
jgi:pimeloyl-ACP methyl ester carboxylesterase